MRKQRPKYQWTPLPQTPGLPPQERPERNWVNNSRRHFLEKGIFLLSTCLTLGIGIPLLGSILSPALWRKSPSGWKTIGEIEQFPEGEITPVELQSSLKEGWMETTHKETLWVKRWGQQVIVFSSTCTHAGCRVTWNHQKQRFLCPCHGGQYDSEGRVVAGPPPQPLRRYQVKLERGQVWVKEA
jgi:menaquinol-cytochrome c reductase iron-sulfur subunit